MTDAAPIGHNRPPSDVDLWIERLGAEQSHLIDQATLLEREAARLPRVVETEEQAEQITAWIGRVQRCGRDVEAARKAGKEPLIALERAHDGFFRDLIASVGSRVSALEARKAAYLVAKRERARIEAEREAAEKRRIAEEARKAQEEQRLAREALELAEAKALAAMEAAKTQADLDQAERDARQAARDRDAAHEAEDRAASEAAKAAKADEQANKLLSGDHKLERVSAAGATSTLKVTWSASIIDEAALKRSMGPLGAFLGRNAVMDALDRCARAQATSACDVPGVLFVKQEVSQTRATRTRNA
jgi:hypothetical protein